MDYLLYLLDDNQRSMTKQINVIREIARRTIQILGTDS